MTLVDRNHLRLLTIGGIIALAIAVVVVVVRGDRTKDLVLRVEPITGNDKITVYAGGAVSVPGLYTLPRGARLAALLDQAGLADTADIGNLQMATELRDGEQVVVPTQTVVAESTSPAVQGSPVSTSATGPINVNTASEAELESLPGIGPSLAQRIVDYRNEHGPFASLDELANIQGISERMVDDFRDQVTVGP